MSRRRINLSSEAAGKGRVVPADGLEAAFAVVRAEMKVPGDFPADVLQELEAAITSPQLPERDETDLPLLTIDPPGSLDLDQAMHLAREGSGYRVRYAIADVPAFVAPDGAVDREAWRRGQTIYLPDGRATLYPPSLSEDAASLLPGRVRPAYLWDLRLGADGETEAVEVRRALVRSGERFDYEQVQRLVEQGRDERLLLLKEVGERRIALERSRGGASLPMPEQEVTVDDQRRYRLGFRPLVPTEDWNAQISLMTGMAAAEMMLHGEVGVLRTMPEADHDAVARFRRQARALGVAWPAEVLYGEFLRSLDRTNPRHLALIHEATTLFRGAGYTPFDGAVPEQTEHAAVAAPYAHVTAPLRRLVDRVGLVVCEALCTGHEVPDWARKALPALPEVMERSEQLAVNVDRACLNVVEAAALRSHVGEVFDAAVVELRGEGESLVQVEDPAILAPCTGDAPLGAQVRVRLVEADLERRSVRFEVLDG
ncbi:MAG TPA: RNB domain-containing ribonuclease [Segeticoccus sp.]|uniref:RNB domain-containing ribonuclease n=1 Tax=Segeticoccus sp. TaxID=2706531 RepID=UPI002D804AC0|nr:RNB domain-containing ribonuclease [Segeticoccus sp.]HET8602260.1 RNB domain-containing ribonuclease [Segeticoccus sp.]